MLVGYPGLVGDGAGLINRTEYGVYECHIASGPYGL